MTTGDQDHANGTGEPTSAMAWAEMQGDALPDPAELPAEYFVLVDAVRDLVEATALTDLPADKQGEIAGAVNALVAQLKQSQRSPAIVVGRHRDGRIDNLTQAGSGTLNPQAPRLTFTNLGSPHTGEEPVSVEITATCTTTAAHSGPPGKVHGGVIATLLDETLGRAATAAGASGLTAGIDVRYRAGTPYGVPLTVTARYTHSEGRKSFATGEIRVGDQVTAEATAVFIAPR